MVLYLTQIQKHIMRNKFILWGIVVLIVTWATALLIKAHYWIPILLTSLYILGIYNTYQTKHAILRNFPVLGYFRYIFEEISPEIQQYFIERETDGYKLNIQTNVLLEKFQQNIFSNI